ncbi:MAG: hypothetical protein A370_04000 [Clostridium sp. Maddingley MBC34-26]|nr:MAG: hypothetical protein A370_04000 [Clostridium sp. Maddingley MBC34-26]
MDEFQNQITDINMHLLDFLDSIGKIFCSTEEGEVYIRHFYDEHIKHACEVESDTSKSLSVILGYIYCSILYTKESLFNLLPDICLNSEENEWGIRVAESSKSNYPNLSLKYVVKKIRNSFACRSFKINIHENITRDKVFKNIKMVFYDINPNDRSDMFEIELSIDELVDFVKKFNSEICKNYEISRR